MYRYIYIYINKFKNTFPSAHIAKVCQQLTNTGANVPFFSKSQDGPDFSAAD